MKARWRDERNKASINLMKNELFIYFDLSIDCNDASMSLVKTENYFLRPKVTRNILGKNNNYIYYVISYMSRK